MWEDGKWRYALWETGLRDKNTLQYLPDLMSIYLLIMHPIFTNEADDQIVEV
jgi:hypothetical protein